MFKIDELKYINWFLILSFCCAHGEYKRWWNYYSDWIISSYEIDLMQLSETLVGGINFWCFEMTRRRWYDKSFRCELHKHTIKFHFFTALFGNCDKVLGITKGIAPIVIVCWVKKNLKKMVERSVESFQCLEKTIWNKIKASLSLAAIIESVSSNAFSPIMYTVL